MPSKKEETAENLTQESSGAEGSKIDSVETILLVTVSLMGDFADIVGVVFFAIPYIGQVVWLLSKAFSWFIWSLIMVWSVLRGLAGSQNTAKKLFIRIGTLAAGKVLDEFTLSILPVQTASLIAVIYLHNKGESGLLGKATSIMKQVKKV